MTFEEFIKHFDVKEYRDNSVQALCPAHQDNKASLTITRGSDSILVHCHAGCKTENILQTIGLKMNNLYYDDGKENACSGNPNAWIKFVEKKEGRKIESVYHYYSVTNGMYAYTKLRLEGKKIIYGMFSNGRFRYGLNRQPRKSFKALYGDLTACKKNISEGKIIFYVEGEKDVDTLREKGYTAITCGGSSDWQSEIAEVFKNAEMIILADNDIAGKKLAKSVYSDVRKISKSCKIIIPVPEVEKADVTDYFEAGHSIEDFNKMIQQQDDTENIKETNSKNTAVEKEEKAGLVVSGIKENSLIGKKPEQVFYLLDVKTNCDKEGNVTSRVPYQTVDNFEVVLDNDYRFAGRIKYNEFLHSIFLSGNVPWEIKENYRPWNDYDDSALFSCIQKDYGLNGRQNLFDAIRNVSMRNRFHPVKDVLDSLEWDGKEHIRGLLPDYLGVEDTEYTYQVMRLWMLGAVARIYNPGYKFDYTLILQGKQGVGKSTFLKLMALSDDWFNDSLDSLDSDKAAQSLMGSWIIELAELKSLARTVGGVDSVKRFLTASQDKYRQPYARRADVFLRQCVFAGTTNKSDFLQDETGNRRFLIIYTGVIEPTKNLFEPKAMNDIKAAWAEAVHIYKTEKPKLLLPESCRAMAEKLQAESMSDDGKIGIIQEYLSDKHRVCVVEVWQKALQETGRPKKWQASEISNIILGLPEWERIPSPAKFGEYGSQRGFQRKTTNTLPEKNCSSKTVDCSNDFMEISESALSEVPFC